MEHASPIADLIIDIAALLLIAAATKGLAGRLGLPFTVMLVIVGAVLAELGSRGLPGASALSDLHVSRDIILFVFLPTLIFESAFHLDARLLRENLFSVLVLAIPGLLLSTVIIAALVHWAGIVPFLAALVLGAILSATDPVAVIALFRQLGAPKRLTVLVEGESLFNDATAIVAFGILLGVAVEGSFSGAVALEGILEFLIVFLGGIAVGTVLAFGAGLILGMVNANAAIEISIMTVLAYLSFLVGEAVFHVSGVMASLAAALIMAGWGKTKISPSVTEYIENFWEFMAYVANALIFLLVGLRIDLAVLGAAWLPILIVIGAMLVSRAAVIFGLVPLVSRLPRAERVSMPYQTVMFWGGLRGAVALALVLSLQGLHGFPHGDLFFAVVMGAVLFTLLCQGLTIQPLIRRLGLDRPALADTLALAEGRLEAARRASRQIPRLMRGGAFSARIGSDLRRKNAAEIDTLEAEIDDLRVRSQAEALPEWRVLMLRCLSAQRNMLYDMFSRYYLSESVYRQLDHEAEALIDRVRHRNGLALDSVRANAPRKLVSRLVAWATERAASVPIVARLRLKRFAKQYELDSGRYQAHRAARSALEEIAEAAAYREETVARVRGDLDELCRDMHARLDSWAEQFPEFVATVQENLAERMILALRREAIEEEIDHGSLNRGLGETILEDIDTRTRGLAVVELSGLALDPAELLAKVPFLAAATPEEFAFMAEHLELMTLDTGETVITQGEAGDALYLIARGVVRVSRVGDRGAHDLASLMAGDFLGEIALLSDEPRTATCRAVTPCAIYRLRRRDFAGALESCPNMREALSKAASARQAEQRETERKQDGCTD